ncbi:MAG: ThiF family adenylyltransferase, partial [Bacteroidia bacterium]|nr:ThiF family adenylyltransferase [Bacteroidia bacterium]
IYPVFLDEHNAESILENYDYIIDACDNVETRYIIEACCIKQNKVWVYGAISKYEGQLAVFNYEQTSKKRIQYSDIFPKNKDAAAILSCSETGVLGTLPGIIGTMQANEVIKLIVQAGNYYTQEMLVYNCLNNQFYPIKFPQTS